MKISVVIPTRNRLDLLKSAITSVLKQNYTNWELIISDNASSEDVGGYIQSLEEPRIKYSRSDEFLSITQSWNRCIELSSGDYVIMLGDDDILLSNHFEIIQKLISKFKEPDLIYTNAYLYAYPGVLAEHPHGIFQSFGSLHGMPKHETPFFLDQETKRALLQETLRFRSIYSTNMQHALIKRSLLQRVKRGGQVFHSPYPDIYAMSALFLEADQILIYPKELVVIGISSKSHGCFAINNREKDAMGLLNIKEEMSEIASLHSVLLPGFVVYNFWLGAIELFKLNFDIKKLNLKLDYSIYKKEQVNYIMYFYLKDKPAFQERFNKLVSQLNLIERFIYIFPKKAVKFSEQNFSSSVNNSLKKLINFFRSPNHVNTYTPLNPPPGYIIPNTKLNGFSTILEIFDQVKPVDCTEQTHCYL